MYVEDVDVCDGATVCVVDVTDVVVFADVGAVGFDSDVAAVYFLFVEDIAKNIVLSHYESVLQDEVFGDGDWFDFAQVYVAKLGVLVTGEHTDFMTGDGADLYGLAVVGNEVSDL